MSKLSDALVQPSKVQTDADQLDGSADKGQFRLHTAMSWLTVLCHSDAPMDWNVSITVPNPGGPDVAYAWLSLGAKADIVDSPNIPLPKGTIIKFQTNNVSGGNPKCQIVTKLFGDPHR